MHKMRRCKGCVVGAFGACGADYCYGERQGLIEEAEYLATREGHVLGSFEKVEGQPIWRARCVQCGRRAAIALDPARGETQVYGEATTDPCAHDQDRHDAL
jgi:hypothetical protein